MALLNLSTVIHARCSPHLVLVFLRVRLVVLEEVKEAKERKRVRESLPLHVEAVAFSPVLPVAVTGSLSGVLGVWDMPTQKLRQRCNHDAGVVRLYCSKQAPIVFTGCLDGVVRGWDLRSGECIREWQGHSDHILDMAVSQDENHVISVANDGTVRVFKT